MLQNVQMHKISLAYAFHFVTSLWLGKEMKVLRH